MDATSIAHNRLKAPVTANIIMLGALNRVAGVVSRQALEKVIMEAAPTGKKQLNLEALNRGFETVEEVQ